MHSKTLFLIGLCFLCFRKIDCSEQKFIEGNMELEQLHYQLEGKKEEEDTCIKSLEKARQIVGKTLKKNDTKQIFAISRELSKQYRVTSSVFIQAFREYRKKINIDNPTVSFSKTTYDLIKREDSEKYEQFTLQLFSYLCEQALNQKQENPENFLIYPIIKQIDTLAKERAKLKDELRTQNDEYCFVITNLKNDNRELENKTKLKVKQCKIGIFLLTVLGFVITPITYVATKEFGSFFGKSINLFNNRIY